MINVVANRYAEALFQVGIEGNKTTRLYNELVDVCETISSNKELGSVLESPLVSKEEKKKLVNAIFNDNSSEIISFFKILIDKDRCKELSLVKESYKNLMDESNNAIDGTVITAIPLEKSKIKEIEEKLSKKYNKNVTLTNEVDESILGGVLVRLGNEVIDGTVSSRLSKVKEELFKVIS